LSTRGSYRSKFIATKGETDPSQSAKKAFVRITDEQRAAFEEGKVILIDKPLHWTSFDVVNRIRGLIRIKKVGHAGTLDPLATGLLIICTGKYTKRINEYMAQKKTYTGSITLGSTTPTYDLESQPEPAGDYVHLDANQIHEAVNQFQGDIMQMPPLYAAIKIKGTPMYELARRGKDIELQPRPIHIETFAITEMSPPELTFHVVCSTGTYIRSLAHDYGQTLGCGAYLSALRRTAIGNFKVEDAVTLDGFLQELRAGGGTDAT
jgi:tRNA pseudouridine55 synthase